MFQLNASIVIFNKTNFKAIIINKDMDGHFIIKHSIYQEDIKI